MYHHAPGQGQLYALASATARCNTATRRPTRGFPGCGGESRSVILKIYIYIYIGQKRFWLFTLPQSNKVSHSVLLAPANFNNAIFEKDVQASANFYRHIAVQTSRPKRIDTANWQLISIYIINLFCFFQLLVVVIVATSKKSLEFADWYLFENAMDKERQAWIGSVLFLSNGPKSAVALTRKHPSTRIPKDFEAPTDNPHLRKRLKQHLEAAHQAKLIDRDNRCRVVFCCDYSSSAYL